MMRVESTLLEVMCHLFNYPPTTNMDQSKTYHGCCCVESTYHYDYIVVHTVSHVTCSSFPCYGSSQLCQLSISTCSLLIYLISSAHFRVFILLCHCYVLPSSLYIKIWWFHTTIIKLLPVCLARYDPLHTKDKPLKMVKESLWMAGVRWPHHNIRSSPCWMSLQWLCVLLSEHFIVPTDFWQLLHVVAKCYGRRRVS